MASTSEIYKYKVLVKALPAAMNMKKYEEAATQLQEEMNRLGAEGWDLVQWKNGLMIFKRKVNVVK